MDQDCLGGDDFDLDADGVQARPWGLDEDGVDARVTHSLAAYGSCTGAMGFVLEGATPGGTVEVYEGEVTGGYADPPGVHPCDGSLVLHLAGPRALLTSAAADASGRALLFFSGPAFPEACTHLVQSLDVSTCTTSATHSTPP